MLALDLIFLSATRVLVKAGAAAFEALPKVSARRRRWNPSALWKAHDVPLLCLPWLYALPHSMDHLQHFRVGRRGTLFSLRCIWDVALPPFSE